MSVSNNIHNSLTINDLSKFCKKLEASIVLGNEARALELINSLSINHLRVTLKSKGLELWPCSLLETAQANHMTNIIKILKEITQNT